MRGFGQGVDSAMFDSQLKYFKEVLLGLYRQKTKIIAERESLRFQYLTQAKAKWGSLLSAMFNQAYADRNNDGEELLRLILHWIQTGIPMVQMNGGTIQGWAMAPGFVGGRLTIGMLSPTSHLLTEPFNEPNPSNPNLDMRPFYKLYNTHWTQQIDVVMDQHFLANNNIIYNEGAQVPFTIPPSEVWMKAFLKSRYSTSKDYLIPQIPYVQDLMGRTWGGSTLDGLVAWIDDVLRKLIYQTLTLIRVQKEIDVVEIQLTDFVNEYAAYSGMSLAASDIMRDLMVESEKAETSTVQLEQVAQNNESQALTVPTEAVAPTPKSKVGLFAAAAAAIFLLTRK